jgi:hypothetical protein
MTEPEQTAKDQPAQFPEADGGGGRSGRGPSTHVPGEQEPGGVLPPYEGRTTSTEDQPHDGAGQPTEGLTSPAPDTEGGRTASPADQQPASDSDDAEPSDPGVGPAHVAGTNRGEKIASGKPPPAVGEENEL